MQQVLEDILICPKTKSKIVIDAAHSIARTEQSHISYPIKAGIIDFLPDTADRISKAYDSFADAYNSYMTSCGLHWKLYCLIGWGLLDDSKILQKVLSSIPDDFDGVLLDVPVGTGLFTVDKYRKLNKAKIIAIDYSLAMLQKAKTLYTENGIRNVTFIRGDVGNVPIQQASIDFCASSMFVVGINSGVSPAYRRRNRAWRSDRRWSDNREPFSWSRRTDC